MRKARVRQFMIPRLGSISFNLKVFYSQGSVCIDLEVFYSQSPVYILIYYIYS